MVLLTGHISASQPENAARAGWLQWTRISHEIISRDGTRRPSLPLNIVSSYAQKDVIPGIRPREARADKSVLLEHFRPAAVATIVKIWKETGVRVRPVLYAWHAGHRMSGTFDDNAVAEMLRAGGPQAITLFLRVSLALQEARGVSAVKTWVRLALPALPQDDVADIISLLIEAAAIEDGDFDFEAARLQ